MDERNFQIPIIIDTYIQDKFLASSFNKLFELHEIQEFREQRSVRRFVCYACRQQVILHATPDENSPHSHRYHFQHPKGIDCKWKYDQKNKAQIYNGIKEGSIHKKMKQLIVDTLTYLKDWEVIDIDHHFIFNEDRTERAKPDIHARYMNEDIAFEIQLRSEKPETIYRRQKFYQEKGWKLIWVSAENSEIVSKNFSEDCIKVKQVQKDIAFSNRGNWFIFNKKLSSKSIEDNQLTLRVKIWKPEINNNIIDYSWHEEIITFSQVIFSEGQSFISDFHEEDRKLKSILREEGLKSALLILDKEKPRDWGQYIQRAKDVWPSLEVSGEDTKNLKHEFDKKWDERILKLKYQIVRFFQSEEWRENQQHERWYEISSRVSQYNFGITHDANLGIIEKILLILGYSLSRTLSPQHKRHIQSCHYFLDSDKYYTFDGYLSLCEKAIQKSPWKDEINSDRSILKRSHKRSAKPTPTDLDKFLDWFTSPPQLHPSNVLPSTKISAPSSKKKTQVFTPLT
ncbi:hypothetical protein Misp06_03357 [Microbulbifer sp. NBRC 101763]|uniref:DUF6035 family protein n=1 Tax=Microbulbifer sp. NBRC 101763 TaxID=1113820 RepID=UPI0030ADF9B6